MDFSDTKHLLSKFGVRDSFTPDDAELVHRAIAQSHQDFGLTRFKLGALLLAVKEKELWRGKARSFSEYLESEHIKASAARQYMCVAEKFLFELKLDNRQLLALSRTSMTTLVKACSKINKENMVELIALLEGLSDRDATHALDELDDHRISLSEKRGPSTKIKKMMSEYWALPNDLRVEFLQALRVQEPLKVVSLHEQSALHQTALH